MIGRPYAPTDTDNEFGITRLLGHEVTALDASGCVVAGTLANVHTNGEATIERDGFVVAIVQTETVSAA